MLLINNIDFEKLFHGVYDFLPCENGYMSFSRYSKSQREYLKFNDFFFVRTTFDGSITLEFSTNTSHMIDKFKQNNIIYVWVYKEI